MTDFELIDIHRGDDRIPRNHQGRYVLPDPETGKMRPWTRVTTVAETLKDRYALERWDQRNIIYGIGQRPGLYAKAAAATLDDTNTLDDIATEAHKAADGDAGADTGSALHTFCERLDRGEEFTIHDDVFALDVEAYRLALEMAGINTALGWIERVVFVPLGDGEAVVGQLDRVNNAMEWTLPRIGDLKSATDKVNPKTGEVTNTILEHGMADIPLQLAMYSRATHWWDIDNDQWVEMPPVDQDRAMIFHVPAGMGECRIYEVDIAAGWEAVKHAMWVRGWRKRKGLYETVLSIDASRAPEVARAARGGGEGEASTGSVGSPKGGEGDDGEAYLSADDPSEPVDPPAPPSPPPSSERLCPECTVDEDPAPWCDCQHGDPPCRVPCKQRAHHPDNCPTITEPGDGTRFNDRFHWCRERVNAIKEHDGPRARLAGLWSVRSEIPTFPNGGPRDAEELSAVIGMCDLVEMEFQMPFGPPDPTAEVVGGTPPQRRRAEHEKAEAAKAAAMSKARTTRKAKK